MFYYDEILNNDELVVKIFSGGSHLIAKGFFVDDLILNISHQWTSNASFLAAFIEGYAKGSQQMNDFFRNLQSDWNAITGGGDASYLVPQKKIVGASEFIKKFDGTNIDITTLVTIPYLTDALDRKPVVNVKSGTDKNINFTQSIRDEIKDVLDYFVGHIEKDSAFTRALMAPNGYNVVSTNVFDNPPVGTFKLVYGNKHIISNLIPEEINVRFSPQKAINGEPLMGFLTIKFGFATMVTKSDIRRYI